MTTIPADILETADAMGYTGRAPPRCASSCRSPSPLIIAGLRVASVSTIGLVTIAAIIGDNFGGLGVFINEGLRNFFPTAVYTGALMSVVLAVIVDLVFVFVGNRLTPWTRIPDAEAEGGAVVIPPIDPPTPAPTAPTAPTASAA